MNRYTMSSLVALIVGAAFWAYTIIDTLIDLGALYVLGVISGVCLGLILAVKTKGGEAAQLRDTTVGQKSYLLLMQIESERNNRFLTS